MKAGLFFCAKQEAGNRAIAPGAGSFTCRVEETLTARAVLPILRDGAASTALQYAPKHHAGRAKHCERGDPDDSLRRDRARLLLHDARVAGAEQDADQKER